MNVVLLPHNNVRPHEEVHPHHVLRILTDILVDGVVVHPLIVARNCQTLLDGHHRYHALRLLNVDFAPCFLVDYDDKSKIEVAAWRSDEIVNAQIVRSAASTGAMLPPKTSRHILKFKVPPVHLPLVELSANTSTILAPQGSRSERGTSCMMARM